MNKAELKQLRIKLNYLGKIKETNGSRETYYISLDDTNRLIDKMIAELEQ